MLSATKTIIEKLSRTNFHKDYKVGIPERISLAQLYRWLTFEFTPLPESIELQLSHLPIFDPQMTKLIIRWDIGAKVIEKIKSLLKDGSLQANGRANDQDVKIPAKYWQLHIPTITWGISTATVHTLYALLEDTNERITNARIAIDSYKKSYSTLSYSDISFSTEEVVRLFDGLKLTENYVLRLKEQMAERALPSSSPSTTKNVATSIKERRGAKPQHNWQKYEGKFKDLIADYGMPGIDQPELKNQAAIESKLIEWGEKEFGEAPAPSTMRRYVSQWLKETEAAHN